MVWADGEVGNHGAVLCGYDVDVGKEEVVDWGGFSDACPAGVDAFQRRLLGLYGAHCVRVNGSKAKRGKVGVSEL